MRLNYLTAMWLCLMFVRVSNSFSANKRLNFVVTIYPNPSTGFYRAMGEKETANRFDNEKEAYAEGADLEEEAEGAQSEEEEAEGAQPEEEEAEGAQPEEEEAEGAQPKEEEAEGAQPEKPGDQAKDDMKDQSKQEPMPDTDKQAKDAKQPKAGKQPKDGKEAEAPQWPITYTTPDGGKVAISTGKNGAITSINLSFGPAGKGGSPSGPSQFGPSGNSGGPSGPSQFGPSGNSGSLSVGSSASAGSHGGGGFPPPFNPMAGFLFRPPFGGNGFSGSSSSSGKHGGTAFGANGDNISIKNMGPNGFSVSSSSSSSFG